MPSGAKKRKAAKRKHHKMGGDDNRQQEDSPKSPNPSSLPPLIQPQGNEREKRPVVIEDEYEETFETPRFQPETPYYSMENRKMGRIDEIEMPSGVNADPVGQNSRGLDLEVPLNEESSKEMKLEKSENSNASKDGKGVKEMKLDESIGVTDEESSIEKELALEKSEIEDQSVAVVDGERTPDASIRPDDVSSSNEKEAKVVPWSDCDRIVESELQKDEGLEETTLENLDAEKEQSIPVTENSKDVTESVRETPSQIDIDLIRNILDKSAEKSSLIVENSDLITEEATQAQGSKTPHENLEGVVGSTHVLPHVRVKEATNCSLDAEKVEIAQREEVARGPAIVRRATIWNCCGLLEVLASSDR